MNDKDIISDVKNEWKKFEDICNNKNRFNISEIINTEQNYCSNIIADDFLLQSEIYSIAMETLYILSKLVKSVI